MSENVNTENTENTTAEVPELQARLDEFLNLVHKTADDKGYCSQYEDVLRSTARNNPDKLEYVPAPVVKTLNVSASYQIEFPADVDPEAEFKAWCEANGKEYAPYLDPYASTAETKHFYHRDGYLSDKGYEARDRRYGLVKEWEESLLRGDHAKLTGTDVADPAISAKTRKTGRGRLVCKTA